MYHHLFPAAFLELQKEIQFHPNLILPEGDFVDKLVAIATYCEVEVDGTFTPAELEKLASILRDRLFRSRSFTILR